MEIICNLNGKTYNETNKLVDESSRSSTTSSSNDSKPLIRNKMNIDGTKSQILDFIKNSNNDVNLFVTAGFDNNDEDSEKLFCLCKRKNSENQDDDMMIECDVCKDWLHFKCVNINQRISIDIETYVCPRCVSDTRNIVFKKRKNNHRHDYSDSNAAKKAVQAGTRVFCENLLKKEFPDAIENNIVIKLHGSQITLDYFEKNGFDKPILVEDRNSLNFNIPTKEEIDLTKIEDIVGSDVLLDVIDVERQETVPMTINELNNYFKQDKYREKIYNLISFEISKTKLSENVCPPNIVNEISWISNGVWPSEEDKLNNSNNNNSNINNNISNTTTNAIIKPEVQKYCLISSGNSYTDFHIDFGGSSVWYHIVKGDKIFYLIEPNNENLEAYEKWNSLKNHSEVFLADRVKNCYKFYIKAGNTIFLPTGWIHAVYTPQDSLVFGGNFLQCFNIPLQIKVYEMELRLKTPEKYRFPAFETLQWYAAKYYTQMIKDMNTARKEVNHRLLTGLKYLQNTLKKWIHTKDYYQLHDHEIPRRINCDKLVKIMHKELGKAEMNLKLNGVINKTNKIKSDDNNKLNQNKFVTEMINHLDKKRMFIDGSNDNSTDEEKISSITQKDTSFKKNKEVLNYGGINLLEIKLDNELETSNGDGIDIETNITIKQQDMASNVDNNEIKKEPLILKIPKIAIKTEQQVSTSSGTLKLKLKLNNSDVKASKKEKSLDELISKDDDTKINDKDDEIISELTKHSYADNEYFYPSLNEKRKSNEKTIEHDHDVPTADIAKSGRKRKLKPHAAQYLQPPKQIKEKEETSGKKAKKINDKIKGNAKNENQTATSSAESESQMSKRSLNNKDDDEDYVDDGEDLDDEDFKLKCKNNLKLSKKLKKNLIKQQKKEESQNESANSTLESTAITGSNSNSSSKKNEKSVSSSKSKQNETNKKFKKGYSTTKQRLGKLLKLNRVINI